MRVFVKPALATIAVMATLFLGSTVGGKPFVQRDTLPGQMVAYL